MYKDLSSLFTIGGESTKDHDDQLEDYVKAWAKGFGDRVKYTPGKKDD